MENAITLGMKYVHEMIVTEDQTAHAVGNEGAHVFSTPAMLLLMENTCGYTILPSLGEGQITVGTMANFEHLAATPIGMKVRCEAEVIEIDRRRVRFSVVVYDEVEKVGEGTHDRFIIKDAKQFVEKTNAKNQVR